MRVVVGQVPVQPLALTLYHDGKLVDPADYTSFELYLTSPEGVVIPTTGGTVVIDGGKVKYSWPPVTLFATPGDYSLRVACRSGAAVDWTDRAIIEAHREGR